MTPGGFCYQPAPRALLSERHVTRNPSALFGCRMFEPASKPSLRVLVVEDSRMAANALQHLLKRWGHEVRLAHDGNAALAAAAAFRPQIVLLDIDLPGMDGWQVSGVLRAMPSTKNALFLAVTRFDREEDLRQSLAAGCHGHMVKPVDVAGLKSLLEHLQLLLWDEEVPRDFAVIVERSDHP